MPALPAPSSTSNTGYAVPTAMFPSSYGRQNFWRANQEKLDRCYAKTVADEEKEARRKEEDEKARRLKEEEERKEEWKKERERLEAEMTARLDKRMEDKNNLRIKEKSNDESALKDELEKIRKENEKLRRLLTKGDEGSGDDGVSKMQKEIADLRRQVQAKKVVEDDIFAMKQEIEQLRASALAKGSFQVELESLSSEVSRLKLQGIKDREQAQLWKGEALRPGNKRGSIAIGTPEASIHGSPRPRWTDNIREADRWKEYAKMKEMHRAASLEAEVLKGKRAVAEGEVIKPKEQLGKTLVEEPAPRREGGGTNLKTRLEAVANRSARKGLKATPRRDMGDAAGGSGEMNDRFLFIEAQKKDLRNYKKSGLEILCREAGLKLRTIDLMIGDSGIPS
ncbi:hypothetical protein CBR_g895 [Chara braunii]|uniref:Uncharacterized protein n=1 Tax=Chara braunii TaxID=69332 RepID=A0A388KCJ0_CHABU|nr:hypothetical protein CBR_g895 [Chara braunii]|eukprot:GBG67770.1 hypothetical protein CBR_g895 [Chara braunii]